MRHLVVGAILSIAVTPYALASSGLEHPLIKIQPDAPYPAASSLEVFSARNEYESFQVVVNGPLAGVSVAVSALTGPGSTIPATSIRCYREAYMEIVTYSNDEGILGPVPDALLPEHDVFFGEDRGAFPFDVPAGENRLVWVDLFVPEDANPGVYAGTVTVSSTSGPPEQLGLTVTVWGFALPSTSSLPTAFGYEGWGVLFGHYDDPANHYDDIVPLAQLYLESALMHRVTLSSMLIEDWDLYADPIDWSAFDLRWGEFFDGKELAFGLEGARATSVEIPTIGDSDPEIVAFWQEVVQHFRSQGWFDLLFDYTLDEPSDPDDYQAIINRAALVHQADADLRVLVTTDIQEAEPYGVEDVIDIWVPIINFMHGKPYDVCWNAEYEGDQRSDYDALVAAGKELWWYQSCMSHGCGDPPDDECYRGWPSYMIDHTAIRNRVMSWMTYRYDIHGELYFDVNYCYGVSDPWQTQFHFDGNGDGTLYYPGRPDVIGGTTHIPIESIRLKHIRDGLEDYEYFLLLEQAQGRDAVLSALEAAITNAYTYTDDPDLMLAVRQQIGSAIASGTVFADGFESADTSAWTTTVPRPPGGSHAPRHVANRVEPRWPL